MSTAHVRARLPATALCLVVMMLAASPPTLAQTIWDQQDQADMFRRLEAQGLIRSPDSVRPDSSRRDSGNCKTCRKAERPDTQPGPDRLRESEREIERDDGADADPRHIAGNGSGLHELPAPGAAMRFEDAVTTIASRASARERHGYEPWRIDDRLDEAPGAGP